MMMNEDLDLDDDEIPTRLTGSQLLTLQVPLKLPMGVRELAALIDKTDSELRGAFGNKMSDLVIRNEPGENPCFQFQLTIPKQRPPRKRVRNRTSSGRGPGRPPKPTETDTPDE